jgi:carnitine O-acetyltransferase
VAANGAAGVNFEHSGVDGHTVLRFVADVYTNLILLFAKTINNQAGTLFKAKLSPYATGAGKKAPAKGDAAEEDQPEEVDTAPKKLEWNLTPDLKLSIRFAETRLSDLICQNEVATFEFERYGKNFITSAFIPSAGSSLKEGQDTASVRTPLCRWLTKRLTSRSTAHATRRTSRR